MSNKSALPPWRKLIAEQCTQCGCCTAGCLFLRETGTTPQTIAQRGPTVAEAYSCALCGLCATLCPGSLNPGAMFLEARELAVRQGKIAVEEYRYLFPDRKNNLMAFYRGYRGLHYDDLPQDQAGLTAFLPGCVMLTYAPELVRTVFARLERQHLELTLLTDCCGLPLAQLGVTSRHGKYVRQLRTKLAQLNITCLITACPNCYYQFRSILAGSPIRLLTVYEALDLGDTLIEPSPVARQGRTVAVHDSCPDRREGLFARQVRAALTRRGFIIQELRDNQALATCCGSGGQLTHFRPDLAEQLVAKRRQEFQDSGAQLFTAYCLGCVLNLAGQPGTEQVQHVLNLLLELPLQYAGVKRELGRLFEGDEGTTNWEKVMQEGETDHGLSTIGTNLQRDFNPPVGSGSRETDAPRGTKAAGSD